MRVYYYRKANNFGDMLSPVVVSHYWNVDVRWTAHFEPYKLLAIGSIIGAVKDHDVIWGSGCLRGRKVILPPGVKVLALRGRLTAELINSDCQVFGDPALLLPLIYPGKVEKKYAVGVIEHYVDKGKWKGNEFKIDVQQDWKKTVDEILSCEKIISSSLHGLIVAEAYGIPVEWKILSGNVVGNGFKFRDYLSGTGRKEFREEFDLNKVQKDLIMAIK